MRRNPNIRKRQQHIAKLTPNSFRSTRHLRSMMLGSSVNSSVVILCVGDIHSPSPRAYHCQPRHTRHGRTKHRHYCAIAEPTRPPYTPNTASRTSLAFQGRTTRGHCSRPKICVALRRVCRIPCTRGPLARRETSPPRPIQRGTQRRSSSPASTYRRCIRPQLSGSRTPKSAAWE